MLHSLDLRGRSRVSFRVRHVCSMLGMEKSVRSTGSSSSTFPLPGDHHESENDRIVWVGTDLKDHLVPAPPSWAGASPFGASPTAQRLLKAPSHLVLTIPARNGASTTSLVVSPPSQDRISPTYLAWISPFSVWIHYSSPYHCSCCWRVPLQFSCSLT